MELASGTAIDVTTIISAGEFIVACNENRSPLDPFAAQCYVELIQTLILQPSVNVIHPIALRPTPPDYGSHPHFLQCLFAAGLVTPFSTTQTTAEVEQSIAQQADVLSKSGVRHLLSFIDKSIALDSGVRSDLKISQRTKDWTLYQAQHVHAVPGSHQTRIPSADGIEEDALGDWVRSAGHSAKGELANLSIPDGETRLLSLLVRALRYHHRARDMGLFYQTHPARRDFLLYFGLHLGSEDHEFIDDVLEEVRGVHKAVTTAGGVRYADQFSLAEISTPLLGGRLWTDRETGRLPNDRWVELITGRIVECRAQARVLREVIAATRTTEGHMRFRRDMREVAEALIRDLGLSPEKRTRAETNLMQVASVAPAATGIPFVTTASILLRSSLRRTMKKPHAQFLYKELKRGYRGAKD